MIRKVIPAAWVQRLRAANSKLHQRNLDRLRRRMFADPPKTTGVERFLGYTVKITDGPNFYMQYKDEFVHQIYHFQATRPDPVIVDGGSNIGMSILYFKRLYPGCRVLAFEPDPVIFALLQENVALNGLQGIELVNAGLAKEAGTARFAPDGSAGGHLAAEGGAIDVRVEPLSRYLDGQVDFLKLNIEGAELDVLREAAGAGTLRNVRELVLEYHGWAKGEQTLDEILQLLDVEGFRYLIHDFDRETNSASKPPFHLGDETNYFLLVYAKNVGVPDVATRT